MERSTFFNRVMFFICMFCAMQAELMAQNNCVFKPPVVTIDFGQGDVKSDINNSTLPNYERVTGPCPNDGYFSMVSQTSDCYLGDWFTLAEDHTPNDRNGNMMIINASYSGGVFFSTTVRGLTGKTTYEFGAWMMNICKIRGGCPPLLPDITILIKTPEGRKVAQFRTGQLLQYESPRWRRYVGLFNTRQNETTLVITMEDHTPGGCGNDFAMDDITIRECIRSKPVADTPVKKPEKRKVLKVVKPVIKQETIATPTPAQTPKIKTTEIKKNPTDNPVTLQPVSRTPDLKKPIPPILLTRLNPLVKLIETDPGEIVIRLYDNGQIDGDSVSIYHNNELIVSKAGLSQKPIILRISVDIDQPHHELVMVADNLGSIPPNTSLMIISANNTRYEVFISSTEQKNARVVIDLKK